MQPRVSINDLYICAGSASLFGALGYDGGPLIHEQRCRYVSCPYREGSWHRPRTALREPYGDFLEAIELCYCCASVVIASGSKFSSFFCGDCRTAVSRLRDALGIAAIPFGRHSLMNGASLSGAGARDPRQLNAFASAVQRSFNRIDRLCTWQRVVVADRVAAMHPDATYVPAAAYAAFAEGNALSKPEMFQQLCGYFEIAVQT